MKTSPTAKNLRSKSLQKQHGLTMISLIFVLAIVGFCGIFAFKTVPMYAENMYVVKALKSLADTGAAMNEMSDSEIKKKLQNFYLINNVSSSGAQNIVIDRSAKNLLVTIDYENRAHLFWNIDIVTTFQNHLNGEHPNLCCKPSAEPRVTKY